MCSVFVQMSEYLRCLRTTFLVAFRGKMNPYSCSLVLEWNFPDHSLAQHCTERGSFLSAPGREEGGIPVTKHQLCCNCGDKAKD